MEGGLSVPAAVYTHATHPCHTLTLTTHRCHTLTHATRGVQGASGALLPIQASTILMVASVVIAWKAFKAVH